MVVSGVLVTIALFSFAYANDNIFRIEWLDAKDISAAERKHTARSHDNIIRTQLWDGEGLKKEPIQKNYKVHLNTLNNAMEELYHGAHLRHKVRHKRRRTRQSGADPFWRFHAGSSSRNVAVYEDTVPWTAIELGEGGEAVSEVNVTSDGFVPAESKAKPQRNYEEEEKKELPVVPKCCASGQNLTGVYGAADDAPKYACARTVLTFQPVFHKANQTHIWSFDSNVFETIVGNPCLYDRYKLDPGIAKEDEFYLLVNGSLFAPYQRPPLLGTKQFCMETFWNESDPAGVTLPLICFPSPLEEAKTSSMLVVYGIALLISVPFLLATACVYTFIRELRDVHGKALACHSTCLAIAFVCLSSTQLAGHAFPKTVCAVMAYLIQFSFVSCFFWLNVMCFDTYFNVRRYINCTVSRSSMRRRFAWYCTYAILLPVLLLLVTMYMDLSPAVPSTYLKPNFGVKGCWFKTDQAALPYFYGPVAAILLSNFVIFFLTSREFAGHYDKLKDVTTFELMHPDSQSAAEWARLGAALGRPLPPRTSSPAPASPDHTPRHHLRKYKRIFRSSCMLCVVMGLSWVVEVASWAAGAGADLSLWSIFDFLNALQGLLIFIIFVAQQPVRSHIKFSSFCRECRSNRTDSRLSVVSDKNSVCGRGRRDYV